MTPDNDVEPIVLLETGVVVMLAVYECVTRLQRAGHVITVSDQGDVSVVPGVEPDVFYVIDASWHDTQAVLQSQLLRDGLSVEQRIFLDRLRTRIHELLSD